ncbi:MAG: Ig-like domain repeat protein, partial [Anaerolineae bacterium]|nr:Ig-like domain repeat protein [Anaerolineae bacterium]
MKKRRYFFILFPFLLFVLSAFSVSLAPLFATALPAGRMLDEGHDTGYIDWNGSVYYENLYHRDGLCPSGCNETVTRINAGSSISGSLEQDASYFEAMAAFEWAGAGTGTVIVSACSASTSWYMGTANNNTPGFVSVAIWSTIPAGCRDWSVSASGGHVHIRSVDVYYPQPPTISGVLNCSAVGSNGWCIGNETLDLTATEPQGALVLISGDRDGIFFTCLPGLFCSEPLQEGIGTANYQATSINGTDSGSTDWKLDTLSPTLSGNLSTSPNALNWFNTDVTLNATASDATSGLATLQSSLDNANWTDRTSPLALIFTDGTYTAYLRATDNAGNVENINQSIQIDTQNPQLTDTFTGTSGSNNWYISDVQVEISQTDPAPSSGIQYFAYSPDGGTTWINYTASFTLSEGVYDLRSHLVDNADNQDMQSQEIKVDTTAPSISGSLDQSPNASGWINAVVNLTASASDATSGIATFESSLDNATWTAYIAPLNFTDGTYTAYLRATDNAGNQKEINQEIKVDTQYPQISHPINGTPGENGWYISDIQVSVAQIDPVPSSGIQAFQTSLDGTIWTDYT